MILIRMHLALTHWDSPFINFRDFAFPDGRGDGYRWVHIKRFHLPLASPSDQNLLAGNRPVRSQPQDHRKSGI